VPENPPASTPPARSADAAAPRTFWQRRVIDPVVAQLTQGITPEKIALTIAVGSALALFPILGTTTLLCFVAGITLRLNQPIIQAVNALCTPLHIPLIYAFVRAGEWLFAAPHHPLKIRLLANLVWEEPARFLHEFGLTGFHAIVVWAFFAPFWVTILYSVSLPILREIVRVKKEAAAKAAAEKAAAQEPPSEHPVP
jgi:uncharacterized protein (DUF2062 family)